MTAGEAKRLAKLIKGTVRKRVGKRKTSSSMQVLIAAKIYSRSGKLTKHFR
jgi:hypothetical protein